jgi:hypothetical protein
MSNRLMLSAQLVLCLIVFSAKGFAQAVVPDPSSIAPVINPPNPQTNVVISLANYLTSNVTVYDAMRQALDTCRQQRAARLVIPPGRYVFDDPKVMQGFGSHIGVFGQSDLIIDGQGSEFVFHFPLLGIGFSGSQRVIIRNLVIDTDLRLASLGVVQKVGANTNIRILDSYPVSASTPVQSISPYEIQNLKWKAAPGEVYYPTNVTLVSPQTFSSPAFNSLADGEEVIVRHYTYEGAAVGVGLNVSDVAFEDITIYGSPGIGFGLYGLRGFRLSRCRIMQRPGTNRPISTTADGCQVGNTFGDILIEDCDFSGQGDDSVNIYANWLQVTEKINARTVVLTQQLSNLIRPGAVLRFVKPNTLAEYARLNVIEVMFDASTFRYTVTVDQDVPTNLAVNDMAVNLSQSNHRFLLRRNYFHEHRARGILIESHNGVVENNRVKDTTWQSMLLFTENVFGFTEAPGAENVIVRNNTFDGCGYGNHGTAGQTMGCVNITADIPQTIASGAVNKNILFEGNTISRTPGLALFISSASGITVSNNVIINSNTLGQFPPWYGSTIGVTPHGSIMVTKSSDVVFTGNLQIISVGMVENGIHVESLNTMNITLRDNKVIQFPGSLVLPDVRTHLKRGLRE